MQKAEKLIFVCVRYVPESDKLSTDLIWSDIKDTNGSFIWPEKVNEVVYSRQVWKHEQNLWPKKSPNSLLYPDCCLSSITLQLVSLCHLLTHGYDEL